MCSAKYKKKWTDKIQALEILLNENSKYTQTQTEKFRQEPTVPLHAETEEGRRKGMREPNLVYPVAIQ